MVGDTLKRYAKVYWKLVKFAAMFGTEYRFSFLVAIFVEVAHTFVGLAAIGVLFLNIKEIAGWNFYELLILYGVSDIFGELFFGLFFIFNLWRLPGKIEKGEIDTLLVKPLNSQFSLTLWQPYFASFPSLLLGVVLIYLGFTKGGMRFDPLMLVPFVLIFLSGLAIAYSISVMITSLSFRITKANALPHLASDLVSQFSNRPYDIFTGFWKVIFLIIFPVAFMTSFPAKTLLGEFQWWWLPSSILLAIFFLRASNLVWNLALRHYTSAGG